MPLVPDYSCSLSPGLGVLLAKPRFVCAFWCPALLAGSWGWDAPSSGFFVLSILLVLHPASTPGWAPALAEKPREGRSVLHVLVNVPPLHPGSVRAQISGSPAPQGSVPGGAHVGHAVGPKWGGRTSRAGGGISLLGLHGGGPGDAPEDHPQLGSAARMPCQLCGVSASYKKVTREGMA